MKSIDLLEHGGGDFWVRIDGTQSRLPDPRALNFQIVLTCLQEGHAPDTPAGIPEWQRRLVFRRWCAAYDLPDFTNARRLAYLVDNYRAAISHDLSVYTRYDLGDLWRARRWTLLLDIIDRLPAHSWYASSVAMDEDHARMMAEAMERRRDSDETSAEDNGPPLTTWTPEVAKLHEVLNTLRHLEHTVAAVQIGKKAGQPPAPIPGPKTPLEKALKRAQFQRRKAAHESLVARVLPQKAAVKEEGT